MANDKVLFTLKTKAKIFSPTEKMKECAVLIKESASKKRILEIDGTMGSWYIDTLMEDFSPKLSVQASKKFCVNMRELLIDYVNETRFMKTELPVYIETEKQAKDFFSELILHDECLNPDDDAYTVIYSPTGERSFTDHEAFVLNLLMDDIFNLTGFDIHEYIIDYTDGAWVDEENFMECTAANWKETEEPKSDASMIISYGTSDESRYWFLKGKVVRLSRDWGKLEACVWNFENRTYANDDLRYGECNYIDFVKLEVLT